MKFEQHYELFLAQLNEDFAQTKLLDVTKYNKDLCVTNTKYYGNSLTTAANLTNALDEHLACTKFAVGYLTVVDSIDHNVDAYCEDDTVVIETVLSSLMVKGVRPMTDIEFQKLLTREVGMKRLWKDYLAVVITAAQTEKNAELGVSTHKLSRYNVDCKLLSLYKDEILDFNGLVKAIYSNC